MTKPIVSDQFDYLFKLVVVGDSGVGKTNLLSRFATNEFTHQSKPTIGVQFATKSLNLQNHKVKAQVWDTAGQQRFRAITQAYYKGASGALIVFDITRRPTYDNLPKWIKQLRQNSNESISVILVGNKSDLAENRCVRQQQVAQFAEENKLFYLETSALDSTNVEKAFMIVVKEIFQQTVRKQKTIKGQEKKSSKTPIERSPENKIHLKQNTKAEKKKKNCC